MTEFVFTYHGGKMPTSKEEKLQSIKLWEEWAKSLGESLVNPGHMTMGTMVINEKGLLDQPSINPISGLSIIKAQSIEDAVELLKTCPHLKNGGSLEVSQILDMD